MKIALVPGENRRQRFENWVSEYSDAVLRTCFIYLGDRSLAEDALQDTFLKVWRGMDRFEGRNGSSARTWIIQIAINTCKNYRLSAWNRHIDFRGIEEDLPQPVADVSTESRELFLAVLALPDKLKQAVILYYYHGMNMTETGEVLHVSRAAVQHRLQRAHKMLKIQMEGWDFCEE